MSVIKDSNRLITMVRCECTDLNLVIIMTVCEERPCSRRATNQTGIAEDIRVGIFIPKKDWKLLWSQRTINTNTGITSPRRSYFVGFANVTGINDVKLPGCPGTWVGPKFWHCIFWSDHFTLLRFCLVLYQNARLYHQHICLEIGHTITVTSPSV